MISGSVNLKGMSSDFTAGASDYNSGGGMPVGAGEGIESPGNWWSQMIEGQTQFLNSVMGGLSQMDGGFENMFAGFLTKGNSAFDQLAGGLSKMGSTLFGSLAQPGGPLSGIAGSMKSAMGFLGPVTSFISAGQSVFSGIKSLFGGKKKQRLASPVTNFSDYKSSSSSTVDNSSRSVNVYINGQTLSSATGVDRTLSRAGVDRRLRDQIKELVRSGSNPVA